MAQDKFGFMWFGTQDGLNKYDGYRFLTVRSSKQGSGDPRTTFPNGWLTSLLCDKYGNIWTGMNGSGLVFMHRETGSLLVLTTETLPKATHTSSALSSKFITGIVQDTKARIWIASDKGVDVIESPKETYSTITPPVITHLKHPQLEGGVTAMVADSAGNVWFAGIAALVKYSPLHRTFQVIPLPSELVANAPAIQSLFVDKLGRIWAGTSANGLLVVNPISHAQRMITHSVANHSSLANNRVYALCTDERGYLWVGTDGGVSILEQDISTLADDAPIKFMNCRYSASRVRSLSDNAVRSLYCDASGTMWVGTLVAGLASWHPIRQRFELYTPDLGNSDFLPSRIVRCFYQENDSVLWIGTDGGLAVWNRRNGTARNIHPDTHPVLASPRVWSINPDPREPHIIWLATDGGGFYRFDKRTNALKRYDHKHDDTNSLINNRVRFARFDTRGEIWLATLSGLDVFNPSTETFTHFEHNPSNSNSISHNRVHLIFEDNRGRVWVGTGAGLNRFDPVTRSWKRYLHTNDSTSLPSDWIRDVMQTRDGTIWISTIRGICSFNETTETFTHFGTEHGLANDYVYGILEDNYGYLWMGTDNGLARFDRKNSSFRVFEQADGLQSNEFNTNAYYRNPAGELMFGGVNGFNIINPAQMQAREYAPSLALTSVKIFNVEYTSRRDISFMQDLMLDYRDNVLEFSFAATDFANINRIRYSYWLEGANTTWLPASNRNFATYTNLPPGKYVLHVKATNSDGAFSNKELHLRLRIIPPFWGTWWFRAIIAFLVICGVWGGYRWRVRRIAFRSELLKREVQHRTAELQERSLQLEQSNQELSWANERLNDLNNEKNAILGIAAHDMKTPLGTILTITELLEDKHNPPDIEETRAFASMIRQTSERMLGFVKQVLDMNMIEEGKLRLNPHEFDLRDTLHKVVNDARTAAHPKNITVHLPPLQEPLPVLADQIASIQCLENILSNAVKYSPLGKNVWVELYERSGENAQRYRCISVRDEGQGLTEKDKQRLFTKFARLSARPTGGEHSTGLGLSIVKKLLEAINGNITCESEHGKGATFTVWLPVPEGKNES
jgi:signal transduction histidine kinase/ligand-binding sensor domain-containing protein